MNYQQLTSGERYTISILKRQGFAIAEIAHELGRHRSTIYRKIGRNHVMMAVIGFLKPNHAHLAVDRSHVEINNLRMIILRRSINIYG